MNDSEVQPAKESSRKSRLAALRKERWAVLGAVVLLLGAVAVPQAFLERTKLTQEQQRRLDSPPLKASQSWEFRGFSLQLQSADPSVPFEQYIEEIARTGANTVCLTVAGYQENAASSSLFIEQRKAPSAERLEKLVRHAQDLKLRVILMPIVLLEKPGEGEWRGKIQPRQPEAWWEDYENFILHFAKIAQKTQADVFMVGSELVSLTGEVDRWRRLIAKVRKLYSGRLSYSANWDHYFNIAWWDDLDLVGMTSYYDLVGEKKPSLEVLLDSWKPIRKDVLAWQRKYKRPILFTEVAWPNQEGCAKAPWNYYGNPDKPDPATQANCFEAFFRTWKDEKVVAGVLVWEWRNNPGWNGGPQDTSYFPGGKPAMKVIEEWFRAPASPAQQSSPEGSPGRQASGEPPADPTLRHAADKPPATAEANSDG